MPPFGRFFQPGRAFLTLGGTIGTGMLLLALANGSGAYAKKRTEVELTPTAIEQLRTRAAPAEKPKPDGREACWAPDAFTGHHWPGASRQAEVAVMAADLLLPLGDLRQDPHGEVDTDKSKHRLWVTGLALYSGLGLIILPMFLATVTGLLRRDGGDAKP